VVVANLILRPLIEQIKFQPTKLGESNICYRCSLVCDRTEEIAIRDLLLHLLSGKTMMLNGIQSHSVESVDDVEQTALEIDVTTPRRNDALIEQFAQQLQDKTKNHGLSWKVLSEDPVLEEE
jgi:putative Mg2+ transporter-C (MgtC) family protein